MSGPHDSSHDQMDLRVFVVPGSRLLPSICPHCGAPGTTALALAARPIDQHNADLPLEVYLCDLCSQALARAQTVRVAWAIFATLVAASLSSALTFYWGERLLLVQLLLLTLAGCGLAWLSWWCARVHIFLPIELTSPALSGKNDGARYLACRAGSFSQRLFDDEFVGLPRSQVAQLWGSTAGLSRESRWTTKLLILSPLLLSISWWTGLQGFGQATVRAINMGPDPIMVMIDERRVLELNTTQFEQAELGGRVRVLAGPRKLTLISSTGEILFTNTLFIAPGETVLLTRLLPQFCIYQEQRDYSLGNVPSRLSLLGRGIGAISLKSRADSWFAPLYVASDPAPAQPPEPTWARAVGSRIAVRLVECH